MRTRIKKGPLEQIKCPRRFSENENEFSQSKVLLLWVMTDNKIQYFRSNTNEQ